MPKRFTATEKWDKVWFRKLKPEHKCFWMYLVDRCNHAGIWEVDFELAEMYIGCPIKPEDIKNTFKKQFVELNGGSRWFIGDFVDFQYGELNPDNRAHLSVITILKKEGAYKGHTTHSQGRKDMDKDKDKDKEGGMGGFDFNEIWLKYPKRVGKKMAEKHFRASVNTQKDYEDLEKALANYLSSKRVMSGFVQNGSTFFNNWRDWVDYKEEVCKRCGDKGSFISATGYTIKCDCPAGKRV